MRSPTLRIIGVLAAFDVVFASISAAAFIEAFVRTESITYSQATRVIGLGHAVRVGLWIVLVSVMLSPFERWARSAGAVPAAGRSLAGGEGGPDPTKEALRRAAGAAYAGPVRIAIGFAVLWAAVYLILTVALTDASFLPGPGILPASTPEALFAGATALAAFPFVLLWIEYLSAPERARLSLALQAAEVNVELVPFSLGRRILSLALCLTLAPAMWLAGMGMALVARPEPDPGRMILLFLLAVALWAPVCAWLLVQTVARPIGGISAAVNRLAAGEDPRAIQPTAILYRDEIGSLAEGVNEMVQRLADELGRLAAALDENERLLAASQESVRARDRFLDLAAHELRTPLTSLRLSLDSLRRKVERTDDGNLAATLDVGLRQVDRLSGLVDGMLELAGGGEPYPALRLERIDVAELVRELAASLETTAARAGSTLRVEAGAPAFARVDARRLTRALTLLLENALKFGAGRPVDLRVSTTPDTVRIMVRDYGIGIAEADQARVFERFERAVSERHYGGLGVGLGLARAIVDAHGGRIELRSQPDEGSAFLVELPLEQSAQ